MVPEEKLRQITARFEFLEAKMSTGVSGDEIAALAREYAELKPVVSEISLYHRLQADIAEARAMLADPEMKDLAEEELPALTRRLPELEHALQLALLPKDFADARPALIEIRPGTGGDEAALFAADLLRMYQRYAEARGWAFDIIELSETELGGVKEVIANVRGDNVFARLKFESGVHRVQRVPSTESGGRVHTSAATVAVLPEAVDVDIQIDANDLRIDTMRASGAGGQHVNTTDSAVRITHVPTGIVVTSSEKSQHQNRAIAMQVLKTKLYDLERSRVDSERAADRKAQVGSGDRSERIRTYNFPQGRLTDHRINLTLYRLEQVVAGDLDEIIDSLIAEDQATRLAELRIMTGAEALAQGIAALRLAGVDGAPGDARRLFAFATGIAPGRVTLALPEAMTPEALRRFEDAIQSRAARQPVAQIIGQRSFYGRDFIVTRDVLDPRPETETLVNEALRSSAARILDIGTGTGCIILTLLSELHEAKGVGTDISRAALGVAKLNAARLNLDARVRFQQMNWADDVTGTFDLIVSNPPYISADEMSALAPDVRDWEPQGALSPGGDGLDPYRAILPAVRTRLEPQGRLLLEIGCSQAVAVAGMARTLGYRDVTVLPDLDGRDRVVAMRAP